MGMRSRSRKNRAFAVEDRCVQGQDVLHGAPARPDHSYLSMCVDVWNLMSLAPCSSMDTRTNLALAQYTT
eukprot:1160722-Pelagomonas_calceolata.AAC.6